MKYGFVTVASAIPSVRVADCGYNTTETIRLIDDAREKGAEIVVFPELGITSYSCQDLFRQQRLLAEAEKSVERILTHTQSSDIIVIVGVPVAVGAMLLNCAAVMQRGTLLGIVPKTFLPNYSEFYEKRWFASARDIPRSTTITYANRQVEISGKPTLFRTSEGVVFGIEVCEDLWAPIPPSSMLAVSGADIIFNLSASDELIGKHEYLLNLISQQSARNICGYVYSSCGFGESTQDVVYSGNGFVFENGNMVAHSKRFSVEPQLIIGQIDIERLRAERLQNNTFTEAGSLVKDEPRMTDCVPYGCERSNFRLLRSINPTPFVPSTEILQDRCDEIFNIQVLGLAKRLVHTKCRRVVLGISGGLDSTLALLVCVKTFDKLGMPRKDILGVTMPGFGTTDRTYRNALSLMTSLGIEMREISIAESVSLHFKDIGHNIDNHDVTFENSQARERTQILMDLSNKEGALVLGTGDLSELALGWATYNGDHISMYGVNASIPKTLIRYLVRSVAESDVIDRTSRDTLLDIIDTPISPELTPADDEGNIKQKTEQLVGPYELHDFFLYYMLRYGFAPEKIFFLARHAFKAGTEEEKYDKETIKHWLGVFMRRFFSQQFKRSCLPDGPKVGSVSMSPRGDWRMASDASSALWMP
ncbi:MAG: NAD(+) synthase [Prevotella sp.]|uniref:NAD(+) synthase n=1 Tax=Prevotella sp. TaxID=59823 RepID=UPI002A355249|nr:NAD(+) synthase [Prevotella sp.]MDD7318670.1 NAD(+) synthase [Prevotellaceae bacterium]MDY4019374.1 NAD(+) synthase [Prevotella sp.]